jgi:hypothetical protein
LLVDVPAAAMRAKAEVIVKLISPPQVSVRGEEHLAELTNANLLTSTRNLQYVAARLHNG